MRVTIKFVGADGEPDIHAPTMATQLGGAPVVGQLIRFNDTLYTVEEVEWNGSPQPMRNDDLTLWVKPR